MVIASVEAMRRLLTIAAVLAIQLQPPGSAVLFEGARLIPGDGRPPIASSAMLVENGIITRVGAKGSIRVPRDAVRVDLTGKTLMPTLVNAHGHPGFQRGLTYTAD